MASDAITAVTIKDTVFWDTASYRAVEIYRRFQGTSYFRLRKEGRWYLRNNILQHIAWQNNSKESNLYLNL
jgi:hypothetical protein